MWAAGYSFFLLNNVFTCHWGFQKSTSRPPWRIKQTESNSFKFAKFCEEVMAWDFFVFKLYKDFIYCRYLSAMVYPEKLLTES